MTLPSVLCVDDSEAVLALARATLSAHYAVITATSGREGLEKARKHRPDCVLLDLSMPDIDGDEVLARLQADPELAATPVLVVSSELARGESCLTAGAAGFLPKPVRPADLRAAVERVLAAAREKRRQESLAVLRVEVGPLELALPIEHVRRVVFLPATRPLPRAPGFQAEVFDLEGAPVCVLDLAILLGVEHRRSRVERKLVVLAEKDVAQEGLDLRLALVVDDVRDPEEFAAGTFTLRDAVGGTGHPALREALRAVVRTSRGPVAVVEPRALFSPELLARLPEALAALEAPAP